MKSAYINERDTNQLRNKISEIEKTQQIEAEKAKEQEVKQLDESVETNYKKLKSNFATQKQNDLTSLENCIAEGKQVQWYDGQFYTVTEENKQYFRDLIVERYTALNVELDKAKEDATKTVLTKKQQRELEKSESGYSSYMETNKTRFEEVPENKEAIEYLKQRAVYDKDEASGFLDLLDTYYKKRLAREQGKKIAEKENKEDTKKLTSINNLPSSSGKVSAKGLDLAGVVALKKSEPEAYKKWLKE
jgi:hypothetical protein